MVSVSGKLSRVAIVGASSLRGKELKATLEDRNFPADDIVLLDDSFVAGTLTEAGGEATFIRALEEDSFDGAQFAFFCGTATDADRNWRAAQKAGATVIDLTGAVTASAGAITSIPSLASAMPSPPIAAHADPGLRQAYYSPAAPVIIACTLTAGLGGFRPARVVLLFFPPVSERDQLGIEELESQTTNLLSFRPIEERVFGAQVAFNLLSELGTGSAPGLGDMRSTIARNVASFLAGRVSAPAIQLIQAPVFYGYAFAAYAEFDSEPAREQLESALTNLGVKIADAGEAAPNNVSVAGESEIRLARISKDPTLANSVWLWGAADNLRLGATNAVRIAEGLLGKQQNES